MNGKEYGNENDNSNVIYTELKDRICSFFLFNTTCGEIIGNCLYVIYHCSSFEDAIRKVLMMGGDADTNACPVGALAEVIYECWRNKNLKR